MSQITYGDLTDITLEMGNGSGIEVVEEVEATITIGGTNSDPIRFTLLHDDERYEPDIVDVEANELVDEGGSSSTSRSGSACDAAQIHEVTAFAGSSMRYTFICEHEDVSNYSTGDAAQIVVSDEDATVVGSCTVECESTPQSTNEVAWTTAHLAMDDDVCDVLDKTGWDAS